MSVRSRARLACLVLFIMLVGGCQSQEASLSQPDGIGSAQVQLGDLDIVTGQTLYVPAYSRVPDGSGRSLSLTVTLSIHNTDPNHPIVVRSIRYYNAAGQLVHEYIDEPRLLEPLASAEVVVESEENVGIGTNFIVEWVAEDPVYEPIVEALMLNASGNQGISYISVGRVLRQAD